MRRILDIDVRAVLPSVQAPTLVLHATGDPIIPQALGRYLADHLPDCRGYVEIDGKFHVSWREDDQDTVMDHFETFVTGQIASRTAPSRRILTTIVFTDIVDSTRRARELGDARWRELLESHYETARRTVEQFRGRLVERTGDGILASFDGPARAVHCAQQLAREAETASLPIRAGVHTGECEVSGEHLIGLTLHLAARVMASAGANEIRTTRTVRDLVFGSDLQFEDRGPHRFKGFEGEIQVFALTTRVG
jgi:class 3 adenylate cyclase